METAILYNAKN